MYTNEPRWKELFIVTIVIFMSVFLLGLGTQNGQLISSKVTYPGTSQRNYFVTPIAQGGGDCLSWDTACTFRTAVSKLSSSFTTSLYLSGGAHETNNVSDATGTTISTNYVRIFGMNNELGNPTTRLVNGHAAATHVLTLTGNYISVNNVSFTNSDQADKNVIMLRIRAAYNDVQRCTFLNSTGDGGGTGILVDNNAAGVYLTDNQFFSMIDSGIEIGAATDIILARTNFYSGGKGLYLSHASTDRISIQDSEFLGLTTGIDYSAAAANSLYLIRSYFGNCTSNVAAVAAYGTTWFESITESGRDGNTYPLTDGVECSTGDGAWTWTAAATTIIPKETLTKPFKLTSVNFQAWNAAQTYKIELLYGKDSANISLGIFEITLGDTAAKAKVDSPLRLDIYVPAYSMVGAKVMSSTAGVDSVTITLGYEPL